MKKALTLFFLILIACTIHAQKLSFHYSFDLNYPFTYKEIGRQGINLPNRNDNVITTIKGRVGGAYEVGVKYEIGKFYLAGGLEANITRYKLMRQYFPDQLVVYQASGLGRRTTLINLNLPLGLEYSIFKKMKITAGASIDYLLYSLENEIDAYFQHKQSDYRGRGYVPGQVNKFEFGTPFAPITSSDFDFIEVEENYENEDYFRKFNVTLRFGFDFLLSDSWSIHIDYHRKLYNLYTGFKDHELSKEVNLKPHSFCLGLGVKL